MYQLFVILTLSLVKIAKAQSRHVFALDNSSYRTTRPSGNITIVTAKEFPILNRLSIRHVVLAPFGVREPSWYANANSLTYCLRGSALVTIFGNAGEHSTFTVSQGQMFTVPSGFIHHIENLNQPNDTLTAEFITALSHEAPEHFDLSTAFGAMTDAVLGNTYQLPTSAWHGVLKRGVDTQIGTKSSVVNIADNRMYSYPSKYKFDVEKMSPPLTVADGSAKMATSIYWPTLGTTKISMLSLRVATTGMREPHWHPETAEMGYVVTGQARMTILSPGANISLDTYTLKPGDVYFLPRGYPHHIEAIGSEDIMFLVFFDQPVPGDIGFTGTFSAYSKEVLAAAFQCSTNQVPNAPFYPEDLLIVHRVNPVQP